MNLQDTLEQCVLQLKNTETRTLEAVVSVCRKIMSTLYDHYFPGQKHSGQVQRADVPTATYSHLRGCLN